MDIKTPDRPEGAPLARAVVAGALCVLAAILSFAPPAAYSQVNQLTAQQKAILLHQRLTGIPPSAANLASMTAAIEVRLAAEGGTPVRR